ncbi:MAG: chemotaxis protein CheD [Sedimentisphaerales bacterium]|nr:chemotaxis protein CheD [Sedimentisphaerales bacterium]
MKKRLVVDISDAKVSADPEVVLTTYSLGSCIGVCLFDAVAHVGGMLHYQLPSSSLDQPKAEKFPFMFADTGMEILVKKLISMGAGVKRTQVKIAGGASMAAGPKGFDIGKRNYLAIRKVLWQHGLFIDGEDVGGQSPRNMYLNLNDGAVTVRSVGLEKKL